MAADGWNHYINLLSSKAKSDFVEGLLAGNENGQQWTVAWPVKLLAGLGQAGFKKIVDAHSKKSRASIIVPYGGAEVKFICAVSQDDWTFWTNKDQLGDIAKPIIVCSRANTCSVIGLFRTRGGNVDHVTKVVEELKKVNA